MLFQKAIQIFKLPDLRNKILFVLGVFVVFRIMANIPIPGIDAVALERFFAQFRIFQMANVFVGGTLDNLSIAMMGLGPYITSVIILQLLTMIFPQLERMYKEEGEQGRAKFNQYGRIIAVPLALLQGYAMLSLLVKQNVISGLTPFSLFASILTVSAGTLFLMWLGELISEKGIGNGVSLLIFAGIISGFPANIGQMLALGETGFWIRVIFFFAMALVIIAGVVLVNEGRRNIPVSYAKRVRGNKMYGGVQTYLPLNINPAGVIPIIFALSLLLFPGMISSFLAGVGGVGAVFQNIANFFDPQRNLIGYLISYFILIFLFTFFYTAVTFDPKSVSSNLQKMGGFIPGIRPGESTAKFMQYILNRVLVIGGVSIALIAIMPYIVQGITGIKQFQFLIGGTSLLIMVSVILETLRQIKAQLQMHEYDTF